MTGTERPRSHFPNAPVEEADAVRNDPVGVAVIVRFDGTLDVKTTVTTESGVLASVIVERGRSREATSAGEDDLVRLAPDAEVLSHEPRRRFSLIVPLLQNGKAAL